MQEVPEKVTGSTLTAEEFNKGVSQEAQNFVINTGQTLDANNLDQTTQGVSRLSSGKFQYIDNGSTVNNYVVSTYTEVFDSLTHVDQYFNGMTVIFQVPISATGDCTLNVDNLGAVPLLLADGLPVSAALSDVSLNLYLRCVYINGNFFIQKPNGADLTLREVLQGTGGAAFVNSANNTSVEARLDAITPPGNIQPIFWANIVLSNLASSSTTVTNFTKTAGPNRFILDLSVPTPTGVATVNAIAPGNFANFNSWGYSAATQFIFELVVNPNLADVSVQVIGY